MSFIGLFTTTKPLIACIHLQALPGAPNYSGDFEDVLATALAETQLFKKHRIDGLIVENFRDIPFYPGQLPAETVAAMAVITRAVKKEFGGPVGINALRNDAGSAVAIALAARADFIRVNIHTGAALTDQGIIEGRAWETLRLREALKLKVMILADVRVKHATPLGNFTLEEEVKDAVERGMADGIIISGTATGAEVDTHVLERARKSTTGPVLVGSGTTPDNLETLMGIADGFIVGSFFKKAGKAINDVDEGRVEQLVTRHRQIISKA